MDGTKWFDNADEYRKKEDEETTYFDKSTAHEDVFFYTGDFNFVWDRAKSDKNLKERGFDFRTAALVFNDPYLMEEKDYKHSVGENRHSVAGVPVDEEDTLDIPGFDDVPRALLGEIENVLFVVYTIRFMKQNEYYRIISARPAERAEINAYKKRRATMERRG